MTQKDRNMTLKLNESIEHFITCRKIKNIILHSVPEYKKNKQPSMEKKVINY